MLCKTGIMSLLVVLALGVLPSSVTAQSNPYIDDGSIKESPFKFSTVTEVRKEFTKNNLPVFLHYSSTEFKTLVSEFKKSYKRNQPVSPDISIVGYNYLPPKGHFGFTMRNNKEPNTFYITEVMPNTNGAGSIILLYARPHMNVPKIFRRYWAGFSPPSLKPNSIDIWN